MGKRTTKTHTFGILILWIWSECCAVRLNWLTRVVWCMAFLSYTSLTINNQAKHQAKQQCSTAHIRLAKQLIRKQSHSEHVFFCPSIKWSFLPFLFHLSHVNEQIRILNYHNRFSRSYDNKANRWKYAQTDTLQENRIFPLRITTNLHICRTLNAIWWQKAILCFARDRSFLLSCSESVVSLCAHQN